MKKKDSSGKKLTVQEEIRRLGIFVENVVDRKVNLVSEQYGDIAEKLDNHTEMIGGLATDVAIIKGDIEFIKNGLKKKVNLDEFVALEK